jgi:uncharacterized protein YgbK (DUF1537 family)
MQLCTGPCTPTVDSNLRCQLHKQPEGCVVQLQDLEKQLEDVDTALEENKGRIDVMHSHLTNVQQEITYTESRVSGQRPTSCCCANASTQNPYAQPGLHMQGYP